MMISDGITHNTVHRTENCQTTRTFDGGGDVKMVEEKGITRDGVW